MSDRLPPRFFCPSEGSIKPPVPICESSRITGSGDRRSPDMWMPSIHQQQTDKAITRIVRWGGQPRRLFAVA